ncbi:hypothetical protein Tco_0452269 [Tanacetum coccineum]
MKMDLWSWITELPNSDEWPTEPSSELAFPLASSTDALQLKARRKFTSNSDLLSITFYISYEENPLWVSDTCQVNSNKPFLPLVLQLLREIISRSPSAPLLFWLCACDAPSEVGSVYFNSMLAPNLEAFSSAHAPVLRAFCVASGIDVELSIMRTFGYMLTKCLMLKEVGVGLQLLTPSCNVGFSYAAETHGLWVLKGYAPLIGPWRAAVRSRVRVWVGPEAGSSYVTGLSLGRSTDNNEKDIETQKVVKASFGKMKVPKMKTMTRTTTRTTAKTWRWDQDSDGHVAIFDAALCDNTTGVEVSTWQPHVGDGNGANGDQVDQSFRKRYTGVNRSFTKSGNWVLGEGLERVKWRLNKDMEGSVLKWRIGGQIWVSYFPNEVKSSYFETRQAMSNERSTANDLGEVALLRLFAAKAKDDDGLDDKDAENDNDKDEDEDDDPFFVAAITQHNFKGSFLAQPSAQASRADHLSNVVMPLQHFGTNMCIPLLARKDPRISRNERKRWENFLTGKEM